MKGIIVVLALIYVAAIITCVNYVWALAIKNGTDGDEAVWSDRSCGQSAKHVVSLMETNMNKAWRVAERFPYVVAVTINATTLWSFSCFGSVILMKWIVTAAHCSTLRHVVTLGEADRNLTWHLAERFPYVAAVTRNSTGVWAFACFATVILAKWIVASAHCRMAGHTHRAILFYDFAQNRTHSFPILFWRLHEKYNRTLPSPKYDIAVAKLNVQNYHYKLRPAVFDKSFAGEIEASVWKTVSTMDKKLYLTNQFDKYDVKVGNAGRCYESFGVEIDDSMICVDASSYGDCFAHDFGPIFAGDKVVGLLLVKPVDCDMKLSIFTNISYYTPWILKTTV